jgi:hypothetical protein
MNIRNESLLAQISPQLRRLEKRDWELWAIVSGTGILVSLGLSAIILPSALLKNDNIHFEITVSRSLAVGLVVLLALLNSYLIRDDWRSADYVNNSFQRRSKGNR